MRALGYDDQLKAVGAEATAAAAPGAKAAEPRAPDDDEDDEDEDEDEDDDAGADQAPSVEAPAVPTSGGESGTQSKCTMCFGARSGKRHAGEGSRAWLAGWLADWLAGWPLAGWD